MITLDGLKRILEPVVRRINQIASRARITRVDDDGGIQKIQAGVLADETIDGIDRVQEYGFTSRPKAGAQAVVLCISGMRDHPVVIATDDGRYRIKLEEGECAIYDDQEQWVKIARDKIHVKTPKNVHVEAGDTVTVEAATKIQATAPEIDATASTKVKATSPLVEVVAATKVSMQTPLLEVSGLIACAGIAAGGAVPAAGSVKVTGSVEATANVKAAGNVEDLNGTMQEMRGYYNGHTHGLTPGPSPAMT